MAIPQAARQATAPDGARRRGPKPRPIEQQPKALWETEEDPSGLPEALDLHMRRFGDTAHHLGRVFAGSPDGPDKTTFQMWRSGKKTPTSIPSQRVLVALAERYQLPSSYFTDKVRGSGRAGSGHKLDGIAPAERRRLAWHLPADFDQRSAGERAEILAWVRRVMISGATDYRRYQAQATKHRFGMRFSEACKPGAARRRESAASSLCQPSARLAAEMSDLVRFKTRTLCEPGRQRSGVWGPETASQRAEHLGLLFGALAADPAGPARGLGLSRAVVSFGLLAFPAVWDWYLAWREARRGFFTAWEVDMLQLAAALTRAETGWLRQTPNVGVGLAPIEGLISEAEVLAAQSDWPTQCDLLHRHVLARMKEADRVARVHRDPFEAILPVLEADRPLQVYRRIPDEILRRAPNDRRYPLAAAEAARAFLMLRFGLHLGVRQKNLRELLLRPRGEPATPERRLEVLKRGELRWSRKAGGWEVLIPASAFKNAGSSYFASKPFQMLLPDLAGLYPVLEQYLDKHRARLLGKAVDPGVLFVKTVKRSSRNAAYNSVTFYEAWRLAIQRYGIFNPYTGRGAIEGLLPHGPHNVRDVLATHVLKQTGSYEQASYAIQDTVDTVAKHYGRFLPQDKAAMAARVLNKVWQEDSHA